MKLKEKITLSFEQKACSYSENAFVQKYFSDELSQFTKDLSLTPTTILEIGCGTGFLTKNILTFYSGQFTISDISVAMLEACKKNVGFHENVEFLQIDGENIPKNAKYDLIISSLTFQWFEQLENSIFALYEQLQENGTLIFSFFNNHSFSEWKEFASKTNYPYTGNSLPCHNTLKNLLKTKFAHVYADTSTITVNYPTVLDFFKNFKNIGAHIQTAGTDRTTNPVSLKKFMDFWENSCPDGISVTYQVTTLLIKKI